MKFLFATIGFFSLFSVLLLAQDIDPARGISISYENTELNEILARVSEKEDIYFTYFTTLPSLQRKITCNIRNMPIKEALTELFKGTNVTFQFYGNNIILKEEAKNLKKKYSISGTIIDSETKQPVSYASVRLKDTYAGTIADMEGKFEITVLSDMDEDTVCVSSMGYETVMLSVNLLSQKGTHKVYISPRTFDLPPVWIRAQKRIIKEMGNNSNFSFGSLFMDTHGQQTAVWVENKKGIEGKLKSINYYLAGKGNTDAPFRVRVYAVDTINGKPGEDLLTDVLVVTPGDVDGWFSVDVYEYDIHIPKQGIFVAMEGVFPNDFEFYQDGSDFIDISGLNTEPEVQNVINTKGYGQRLGFNKRGNNHTWHYSIDHTWYQIDKRNFNAMISADIITKKRIGKFFNFGNNENQN